MKGRILEAELRHILITKLLSRINKLGEVLEENPHIENVLVEIRQNKQMFATERSQLEQILIEAYEKDAELNFQRNELSMLILGENFFRNLILDDLSAELEYMLFLKSEGKLLEARILLNIFRKFVQTSLPNQRTQVAGLYKDVWMRLYYDEKRTTSTAVFTKKIQNFSIQLNELFVRAVERVHYNSFKLDPLTFVYMMTVYAQALTSFDGASKAAHKLLMTHYSLLDNEVHLKDYLSDLQLVSSKKGKIKSYDKMRKLKKSAGLDKIKSPSEKSKYVPKALRRLPEKFETLAELDELHSRDYINKSSFLFLHAGHYLFCYYLDPAFFDKIMSEPKRRGYSYYEGTISALENIVNRRRLWKKAKK